MDFDSITFEQLNREYHHSREFVSNTLIKR